MIIPIEEIINIFNINNITINGCFHIGAHECEELQFYNNNF